VIVVDTDKGAFEFETYPKEAPKTVEHIVALVKKSFYNGQRMHRVVPGFVVQWGDPNSRDMTKQSIWGRTGSGRPVGVAEISPLHNHKVGAVAMAHAGDPALTADSQMYVALTTERTRQLDGKYTVFGQVISGMSVVEKIGAKEINERTPPAEATVIRRMTIRGAAPATKK
jgi:peptidyl-prolyl cis-trans isomerase B (cyclophilin B)